MEWTQNKLVMNKDLKIFLLDDEKIVCDFISQKFKNDYTITSFTLEDDCSEALKKEKPDYFLIDYNLASMDGLCFFEQNKENLIGVYIIFISGQKSLTDMFEVINQTKAKFVIKDENMLKALEYLFKGDIEAYEDLL